MNTSFELIYQLKKKKQAMQRQVSLIRETDIEFSQTLIYRIELINILLAEFSEFKHPKSLANLLKRNGFTKKNG